MDMQVLGARVSTKGSNAENAVNASGEEHDANVIPTMRLYVQHDNCDQCLNIAILQLWMMYKVFLGHKQYFVSLNVGVGKMQWYGFHQEPAGGADILNGPTNGLDFDEDPPDGRGTTSQPLSFKICVSRSMPRSLAMIEYEDENPLKPKERLSRIWKLFAGFDILDIGTPIKVDINTKYVKRGRFTRVCIEVDLTKPVMGRVWMKVYWYQVQYVGLHQICGICSCYGYLTIETKIVETPPAHANLSNDQTPPTITVEANTMEKEVSQYEEGHNNAWLGHPDYGDIVNKALQVTKEMYLLNFKR
ncbi:Zeaxanthin epoxidase, chloroplastic [Glycine soja]|uniref:Zeaxanthin epoxidase, chloroplastic n=1 Tax=Glycine soja TaxID=3848 RepID=A0A445FUN0_GLYSO|nr:Zeaxanthin epoxidase, chloroplastic [Glycine soja]